MLHIVFNSNNMPKSLFDIKKIPDKIKAEFTNNYIRVYFDNHVTDISLGLLENYTCSKINSLTIDVNSIKSSINNIIYELYHMWISGCTVDITLCEKNILYLSFNDELSLEIQIDDNLPNIILPKLITDKIEMSSDKSCKICLDKDICTVNLPCGHLCFCISCTYKYIKDSNEICPICKIKLTEIKRIYN